MADVMERKAFPTVRVLRRWHPVSPNAPVVVDELGHRLAVFSHPAGHDQHGAGGAEMGQSMLDSRLAGAAGQHCDNDLATQDRICLPKTLEGEL